MTNREYFEYRFLLRCHEAGYDRDAAIQLASAARRDKNASWLGPVVDAAKTVGLAGLALPIAAGIPLGAGASVLLDSDDRDVDDLKDREILEVLKRRRAMLSDSLRRFQARA